ncbi:hypothetical protein QE152_g116 [Popillia japonica]|uniref:Uncharacterized protein n=1 Tax=Popillia japonica TaxID=7064 RepID=A0AAW1NE26_POPJA
MVVENISLKTVDREIKMYRPRVIWDIMLRLHSKGNLGHHAEAAQTEVKSQPLLRLFCRKFRNCIGR